MSYLLRSLRACWFKNAFHSVSGGRHWRELATRPARRWPTLLLVLVALRRFRHGSPENADVMQEHGVQLRTFGRPRPVPDSAWNSRRLHRTTISRLTRVTGHGVAATPRFRPEDDDAYESVFMDPCELLGRAFHRDRANCVLLDRIGYSKAHPRVERHESRGTQAYYRLEILLSAPVIRMSLRSRLAGSISTSSSATRQAIGSVDSMSMRHHFRRPASSYTPSPAPSRRFG